MILVIDNYDSFTFNIVQYLGELDQEVQVVRNDELTADQIQAMKPDAIVLSPGPCTPSETGVCLDVIRHCGSDTPILGICLGHQTIAQAFGGKVIHAATLMHGKTSEIFHDGKTVFEGLSGSFLAMRYHSLIVERDSLPTEFVISAKTSKGEVMAIRHKDYPIEGLQFHPESLSTEHGKRILNNFLNKYTTYNNKMTV